MFLVCPPPLTLVAPFFPYTPLPEPEFLNNLKCDFAESVSTGFQFNCYDIFNDKTLNYKHLDHFLRTVKFTEENLFYHKQKL
jgi:hypothetical protein